MSPNYSSDILRRANLIHSILAYMRPGEEKVIIEHEAVAMGWSLAVAEHDIKLGLGVRDDEYDFEQGATPGGFKTLTITRI